MLLDPIRSSLVCTILTFLLGLAGPVSAGAIYDKQWDPSLYGGLDQHSTHCPDLACGPASAVNSFVFLQNMYPEIYGNSLAGDTYENWIDTANILLDPRYMDCDCDNNGTTIENFISGKQDYLNDTVPGATSVHFQNAFDPPAFTKPTWQFLFDELMRGQDIEILVGFYDETGRNGGHYVTVSGFFFGDTNGDGEIQADDETATLFYVDPSDGSAHHSTLDMKNGFLDLVGYRENFDTYIEAAVAESPVSMPEPLTLSLFALGLVSAAALRSRHRKAA